MGSDIVSLPGTVLSAGIIVGSDVLVTAAIATNVGGYAWKKISQKRNSPQTLDDVVMEDQTPEVEQVSSGNKPGIVKMVVGTGAILSASVGLLYGSFALSAGALKNSLDHFNPTEHGRNNIIAYECTLKNEMGDFSFVHIGETHLYNKNSSRFAKKLFDQYDFDSVFHEGYDSSKLDSDYKKPAYEKLLGHLYSGFTFDDKHNVFSVTSRDIARYDDITVNYVETIEENGDRTGISSRGKLYIYSIGLVSYIFRPAIEIQSYGVLLGDCVDNLLLGEYPSESPIGEFLGDLAGLGGGRDYSMTQNFLNSLYEGDSTNPVLVTGSGHLSAMREEFEKEGDFEYKRIFLDD